MLPNYYHIKIHNDKIQNISAIENLSVIEINGKQNIYDSCKVMPSFVDSHCHFHGLGMILEGLLLSSCKSAEECAQVASTSPAYRGDWIFGLGWNQSIWSDKSYPDKSVLDKYFPNTPVFLKRIDAHAAWLNSKALDLLNITNDSISPIGGEIFKDSQGAPTGILLDEAMFQAEKKIPQFTYNQLRSQVLRSQKELASVGITEVHDMDFEPDFLNMFQKMEDNGELYIKSKAYFRAQNDEYLNYNLDTSKNIFFKIVGAKFFMDGALGSHGAALSSYYADKKTKGILILDSNTLKEKIQKAVKHNLNIATHAIGDRAVSTALESFSSLADDFSNLHFRIEHAQLLRESDINLFKRHNIIASLQPIHYYSDIDNILSDRLSPEQLNYAYLWKSFLKNGINIIGGSDFPIESHNPQLGVYAFTNRMSPLGNTLLPDEQISFDDAIYAYTIAPRNLFREKVFMPGASADFIVIDDTNKTNNPFFEIISTYSNGKVIHTS